MSTAETSQGFLSSSSFLSKMVSSLQDIARSIRARSIYIRYSPSHHGCQVPLEIACPSRTTSAVFLLYYTFLCKFSLILFRKPGDSRGKCPRNRLQHMDLPIPSHNARQRRACDPQCPYPWLPASHLQASLLGNKTCLCLRRGCACPQAFHDRASAFA